MTAKRILAAAAALAFSSTFAFAQATAPVKPAVPAAPPVLTAPAKPVAAPAAVTPAAQKTNLNTASSDQLDGLPDVGKARSKAIMDERAKGKFKNWDDFTKRMTGSSVNAGVQAKIKDLVTF